MATGDPSFGQAACRDLWTWRVVVFFIVLAILAPLVSPYDPLATNWATVRKPPSLPHPFGTDEIGRDVLARVIWGARSSLAAGLVSVSLALAVGVPIGLVSGYVGGFVDGLLMRMIDAMLAIPFLILAIALAAFLGPSLTNAMIAIGVSQTPIFARLTRGQVLSVKHEEYIEAARAIGNSHHRIVLRHILPNIIPPLLVQATLAAAAAIIAEAALSFLGLGEQPPDPSWGSMLNTAKNFISQAPWMAVWPGWRSLYWCCRSTCSATVCAMRSTHAGAEGAVAPPIRKRENNGPTRCAARILSTR